MFALREEKTEERARPLDADLDVWHSMAYIVAKDLNLRPLSILKDWTCSELLVAFGVYANDKMRTQYAEYQQLSSESKAKVKVKPTMYAVKFYSYAQFVEYYTPKSEDENKQENIIDPMIEKMFAQGGGIING